MGRATATVDSAMAAVAPRVVPGVSMAQLAEAIEHELRRAGSRCPSFPTHIFTGFEPGGVRFGAPDRPRPHPRGHVGDVRLRRRRRRLLLGLRPDRLLRRAPCGGARSVRRGACRPGGGGRAAAAGAAAREVDAACRAPIEAAGLGEYFRHRMGHSIGMDVHERPFISAEDETPLEAGMRFTNEPSIMTPDRFSVRIEDIFVCDTAGARNLNAFPGELIVNA